MGKTYFIEKDLQPYIKSVGGTLETISNDKIRRSLMDRYLAENQGK